MDYPAEVATFTVTGRLMYGNPDTSDAGIAPNLEPVRGAGILFVPEHNPAIFQAPVAKMWIYQREVHASTDYDGNITGLEDSTPDVVLPYYAGQTWRVIVEVPDFPTQDFSITGSPGGTVNIGGVEGVPSDPGTDVIAWQAVVSQVVAARDAAAASAAAAAASNPGAANGTAQLDASSKLKTVQIPTHLTTTSLAANFAPLRNLDVKTFGAVGNGSTDDTAAIQAAINAAAPGQAILFPATGSGSFYRITDTLTVTTPNLRFIGQPRDAYAMSIRCAVSGKTMISVKAPGFVMQDVGLIGVQVLGSGGANGVGMTVNGIELFGDNDGNIDADLNGCTFQYMNIPVRVRARNATVRDSLFNNTLGGVVLDGIDGVYHTGPNAAQNRGNTLRGNRFHNVGAAVSDAAVRVTTTAKVQHAIIQDNFFDSNGLGRHIEVIGTSVDPHQRIFMSGNKHTELGSDGYYLSYLYNAEITGIDIGGYTAGGVYSGYGMYLDHLTNVDIHGLNLYQIGKGGIYARTLDGCQIRDVKMKTIGMQGSTWHGIDADGSNTGTAFDNILIDGVPMSGFYGNPNPTCRLTNFDCRGYGEKRINSTTLINETSVGRNRFREGRDGRVEDEASKPYDLTVAAGATDIATVLAGNGYTSFLVEVEIIGRNSVGPVYAKYTRYVRPENGTPAYATPVTDYIAGGQISVSFVTSGTTGVKVQATVTTNDAFVTAFVRARAGGAAATGSARSVVVAML